jgi:hypothetical protein
MNNRLTTYSIPMNSWRIETFTTTFKKAVDIIIGFPPKIQGKSITFGIEGMGKTSL